MEIPKEIVTHADKLLRASAVSGGISTADASQKLGLPHHKIERLAAILEHGGLVEIDHGFFKTVIRARA